MALPLEIIPCNILRKEGATMIILLVLATAAWIGGAGLGV
jgi:hypothetical protein